MLQKTSKVLLKRGDLCDYPYTLVNYFTKTDQGLAVG